MPPAKQTGKLFASPLFDIIFKIGTPLGLALVAWMGSKFATQAELDALEGQVNEIQKVLAVMVEQNKVNTRQDLVLTDHEDRLRLLEK
jgi:hypothetical protein